MSGPHALRWRLQALWPYLLIAFLYLATSPYHRGLNNPNEMVRLYMTAAWVDHDTFDIAPVIRQWGMVDDKAERDGVLYSSKAPLQSMVGIPAYAVSEPILEALGVDVRKRTRLFVVRILGSAVFGIGFAWLLLAYARRRATQLGAPAGIGTGLGLVAALGTMLYPYAITYTGHLLAAAAAGGCYLALVLMAWEREGSRRWRLYAMLAGFAGGATPFAEYPAALVAAPALAAALIMVQGRRRLELLGWLALGGAAPFLFGLWCHDALWGSPFKTGYSYLENKGYVEVHGEGFFGVSTPKGEALGGALFSPGTGLFFFSPVLIVGLAMLVVRLFGRFTAPVVAVAPAAGDAVPPDIAEDLATPDLEGPHAIPRALAIAAMLGFVFSLYFISSHRGWRGGWTVGPRYIIAVAPLLWVWVVEAAGHEKVRPWLAAFGAMSIVTTGFAAALYPHLSDIYTNPLATFLWPSYVHGETTYGLAHALGLGGHAANLFHVVPLVGVILYVALAGTRGDPVEADATDAGPGRRANPPPPKRNRKRRFGVVAFVFGLNLTVIAAIPEKDPVAARRENRRLWGFWEPAGAGEGPKSARRNKRRGRVFSARSAWRRVEISNVADGRPDRPCKRQGSRCQYGDSPWQHFGPESIEMDGVREAVLFMHPIAGATVRARVPGHKLASKGVLRYGLADGSVTSDNDAPVKVTLRQADEKLLEVEADNRFGLRAAEFTVTSTLPYTVEITAERDGARVFGWDLELYKE